MKKLFEDRSSINEGETMSSQVENDDPPNSPSTLDNFFNEISQQETNLEQPPEAMASQGDNNNYVSGPTLRQSVVHESSQLPAQESSDYFSFRENVGIEQLHPGTIIEYSTETTSAQEENHEHANDNLLGYDSVSELSQDASVDHPIRSSLPVTVGDEIVVSNLRKFHERLRNILIARVLHILLALNLFEVHLRTLLIFILLSFALSRVFYIRFSISFNYGENH